MPAAAGELKTELHRAWNRKLYLWWGHYNREFLAGALRRPVIRIGSGRRTLGAWDPRGRTLTISGAHILGDPWLDVMETLRHEMAHQFADEVLQAEEEGPHGGAFQEACRRLRCSSRASSSGQSKCSPDPADERVFRRIRKILSLTESPNRHEAQLAVQKARHLLLKHSIDLAESDRERRYRKRSLGSVRKRRLSFELWLATILNEFFFVEVLWSATYEAPANRDGSILEVYGTPAHLEMAEYVYHYLTGLLDRLWIEYRKERRLSSNRERQRFFSGVLEGFFLRLKAQEAALRQEHALVWKGDPELARYYRYLNPRVHTRQWGGISEDRTYRDGVARGRKIALHRPVSEGGAGCRGALKP